MERIARVLKPGGYLAAFWNVPSQPDEPIHSAIQACYERFFKEPEFRSAPGLWSSPDTSPFVHELVESGRFGRPHTMPTPTRNCCAPTRTIRCKRRMCWNGFSQRSARQLNPTGASFKSPIHPISSSRALTASERRAVELTDSQGIGHSSCLPAQRPGMGVMLNPDGEPRGGGAGVRQIGRLGQLRFLFGLAHHQQCVSAVSNDLPVTEKRLESFLERVGGPG